MHNLVTIIVAKLRNPSNDKEKFKQYISLIYKNILMKLGKGLGVVVRSLEIFYACRFASKRVIGD